MFPVLASTLQTVTINLYTQENTHSSRDVELKANMYRPLNSTLHDEHGLREFIVTQMRHQGFLVPQQLRALRRLGGPLGWPATTEAHVGLHDPLASGLL